MLVWASGHTAGRSVGVVSGWVWEYVLYVCYTLSGHVHYMYTLSLNSTPSLWYIYNAGFLPPKAGAPGIMIQPDLVQGNKMFQLNAFPGAAPGIV